MDYTYGTYLPVRNIGGFFSGMAADVSVHIGLDSVNITLISHYSGERDGIKYHSIMCSDGIKYQSIMRSTVYVGINVIVA
jgi:hypothetical protein